MTTRFSNVGDVPLAMAVFLATDDYDHNDDPYTISATTLLKPLRQIILPSRLPPDIGLPNLSDMVTTSLGQAIHSGIENAWRYNYRQAMTDLGYPKRVIDRVKINPKPEELTEDCFPIYLEQRLNKKIGQWTVTGKFDFVGEGRVQDFKTASVWSYMNQVNAEKQIMQGSIYRWLDPKMIYQDEMDIHHIFMDWKAGMVRTDPAYPPKRLAKQTFQLESVQHTERFIRNKIALIEQYWNTDEDQIPLCTDEELWRSEPVYKYYKNPDKQSRSTKNFASSQEAQIRFIEDGSIGLVKAVPGMVTACKYCPAFGVCSQKDQLINSGDLVL